MQSGIVIINKPTGITSRFVVDLVGKYFKTRKVGHTGTLDPMATGVLVVCVNQATKLVNYLTSTDKVYRVEMELGYETDTLDKTGVITYTQDVCIDPIKINNVIHSYIKSYLQEVPIYSSVKVNGKKCYEYARANLEVILPKKEVHIKDIYDIEIVGKTITFTCLVSKGTYVRSLVRDIGRDLNSYATMTKLVRLKQGHFDIKDSTCVDAELKLISIEEIFKDSRELNVDDEELFKIKNGCLIDDENNNDYVVIKNNHRLIAIYEKSIKYENKLKPLIIIKEE